MTDSPQRRSAADLQRILDSLIGDAGFVLSGNLPDVLSAYERDHQIEIIDSSEYAGLRSLCSQHDDLELGAKELFSFLSMIPKPTPRPISPSPAPRMPHSLSMPPAAFRQYGGTPPQPESSRRHSDRIRSPSESSGPSSDDENVTRKLPDPHQIVVPPITKSKQFPASATSQSSRYTGPLPPTRKKTLSDPSRLESPLAMRVRGAGPPSAFGIYGGFARPSPVSRRSRRGSAGSQPIGLDDDLISPDLTGQPPFRRRISSASSGGRVSSPVLSAKYNSRSASPISPVDNTSFFARAKSPESDDSVEIMVEEPVMDIHGSMDAENEMQDSDLLVTDTLGEKERPLDPRMSRISTDSNNSLRTSHDKLLVLQQENYELGRKLKESEKQLTVLGADNERLVEDLQDKLEEARTEITQRRKDEKDLKGQERALLIQISGLEADIQSLQRSLDGSKANHASMQKMYNSQCDEATRLRDLLRDRDEEIQGLEETARTHEEDEAKFNREIQALETEIKRLESDISVARQAESYLEAQKQENLQLKETIDRMRFDLEEARVAIAGGHQRGSTITASNLGTLSRNLGDELNRRLQEAERVQDDGETVVETVVTTQRTRRIGGKAPQNEQKSVAHPVIRLEEGIREYADAATSTDPIGEEAVAGPSADQISTSPPAYTAKPDPLSARDVLKNAHPREHGHNGVVELEYEALVDALGMRCEVIEEELRARKVEREKCGEALLPKEFATSRYQYTMGTESIVNYIFLNSGDSIAEAVGKMGFWILAAFGVGLVAGSHFITPAGLHPRDYALFTSMNSLAQAAGAGEGILPVGSRGLQSLASAAGMVARRMPT